MNSSGFSTVNPATGEQIESFSFFTAQGDSGRAAWPSRTTPDVGRVWYRVAGRVLCDCDARTSPATTCHRVCESLPWAARRRKGRGL